MNETATQNKHYHRNGISGLGFDVELRDDSLCVTFYDQDEVCVPLAEFAPLLAAEPHPYVRGSRSINLAFRSARRFNDSVVICAFDSKDTGDPTRSMIGLYLIGCDDIAFAVFDFSLVLAGEIRFGPNSWRGDSFLDAVQTATGTDLESYVSGPAEVVAVPEPESEAAMLRRKLAEMVFHLRDTAAHDHLYGDDGIAAGRLSAADAIEELLSVPFGDTKMTNLDPSTDTELVSKIRNMIADFQRRSVAPNSHDAPLARGMKYAAHELQELLRTEAKP